MLAAGLLGLWLLASSAFVNRTMERAIERALRRFTRLDVHDYVGLLRLTGAWRVAELGVRRRDAQGELARESAKAAHRAEMAEQDRAEEHDGAG